jgi:hypothetical protein
MKLIITRQFLEAVADRHPQYLLFTHSDVQFGVVVSSIVEPNTIIYTRERIFDWGCTVQCRSRWSRSKL